MLTALLALCLTSPPRPDHDVWIEAETCGDHDFNTIGRDAAFEGCYGGAILQLQTAQPAPPGGYHATFRTTLPAAGWYTIQVAATRTDQAPSNLSPYTFEVTGYAPRAIRRMPVTTPYGHDKTGTVFGLLNLGRYRLPAGEVALTFRCDERRTNDQAYLLYLDALALKRIEAPTGPEAWIRGEGAAYTVAGQVRTPELLVDARLNVLADGRYEAWLNSERLGAGQGLATPGSFAVGTALGLGGDNRVEVRVTEAGEGGVLAWLSGLDIEGRAIRLGYTGESWSGKVLGPIWMAPYGDMALQPMPITLVGPTPIPIKTGNLSVDLITKAAKGEPLPEVRPHPELDSWRDQGGVVTVEDYLGWLPAEPERDVWRWAQYLKNADELHGRGMKYAVYPWIHFPPQWALVSEFWYPLVQLEAGKSTYAPSIWAPQTDALFDRFYAKLREVMGDRVDEIFVSMATDYGEVGYPIGMADWVVAAPFKGAGFWCGDDLARADFKAKMLAAHGSLAQLNAAWGTDFTDPQAIAYPPWTATEGPPPGELEGLSVAQRAQARRRWLDFVQWYLDAMTDFAGRMVGITRRYYPDIPHEIKIGFGSERVCYGADYTAYVARSKQDRYTVRSTHGKLPMFFYRRFSTAAKHYGTPLVTEPPSGVDRDEEVERIYKDATSGTTEYFDYPANLLGASDLFARYGRYLEGRHSLTEVAFLVPTTDHRLRPKQSLPQRLVETCAASSERFDWDVVDDRLVRDGALDRYRVLLMPEGNVFEADVLAKLETWMRAGGVLLRAAEGGIETVEGATDFDRLFPAGAPDVLTPVAEPLPAWTLNLGEPGDEPCLTGDWSFSESGHWEWGGESNGIRKRWSGGQSGVLLAVDPAKTYELAIDVALHPKRLEQGARISINGRTVGEVERVRQSVFRAKVGPEVWLGRNPSELRFEVEAWKPSDIDGTTDTRTLGIAVRRVRLWEVGQPEPGAAPPPRIRVEVDRSKLARECVKPVGAGAAVRLPAAKPADLADLLSAILTDPVSCGLPRVPPLMLPTDRDGVWSAILPDRILLHNSADEPRRVTIPLVPETLQRLGAAVPEAGRATVLLPPHSLGSIELPSGRVVVP